MWYRLCVNYSSVLSSQFAHMGNMFVQDLAKIPSPLGKFVQIWVYFLENRFGKILLAELSMHGPDLDAVL